MKIISRFQESKKGNPDGGEDRLVVTDDFIAVIDGATSKSGEKFDGKTGGLLVAEVIASVVSTMPRHIDAFNAVAMMTQAVREQVIQKYLPDISPDDYKRDRPNASVLVYSAAHQEIWRVGDSHFILDGQANWGGKKIDDINSSLRAGYIRASGLTVEELMNHDIGREIIMPSLVAQSLLMNNPDAGDMGYGAINGQDVPPDFISVYNAAWPKNIVLASDGLLPFEGQGEFDIQAILKDQQDYYARDPLLIGKHKSTKGLAKDAKRHDDITVIAFTV